MICNNCGKELPDGTKFCGACGADLTEATVRVNPPAQSEVNAVPSVEAVNEPAIEAPVVEEIPVVQEAPVAQAAPVQTQEPYSEPPKKKNKLLTGIVAVVLILAALAAAVLLIPSLREKATDIIASFSSPETQQLYAYKKLAGKAIDSYGEVVDKKVEEYAVKGDLTVELGDTAKDLLAAVDDSLNGVESLAVSYDISACTDIMSIALGVSYNGEKLINAEAVIDIENSVASLYVPDLNDKAVKIDLSEYVDEDELDSITDALTNALESIPEEKFLEDLTAKYLEIALKEIDGVDKEKDTLKVGDLKVKATLLTTEFTDKMLGDIALDLLKELKKDKEVEDYILKAMGDDGEQFYDGFIEGIDSAIEDIEDTSFDKEPLFTLKTWTNSSYEILGVEIEADDGTLFIASAESKGKTATEITFKEGDNELFILEGEGSNKRDVISGELVCTVEGEPVLNLKYDDVNTKADSFVGKVTLSSDALSDVLGSEFADLAELTLEGKVKDKKNTLILGIGSKSSSLGTLTATSESYKFKKPQLHKDAADDLEEWAGSIDILSLMTKLSEAGLEDIISGIMENVSGNDDDYYYEDNYDDILDYEDEEDYSDYDLGYDDGYLDGYWDAAYGDEYGTEYGDSAVEDASDEYMEGYESGYDDGYNDGVSEAE